MGQDSYQNHESNGYQRQNVISPTDLMSSIRSARNFERTTNQILPNRQFRSHFDRFSLKKVSSEIKEIYKDNKKIERSVEMQIKGLSKNPINTLIYTALNYLKRNQESPEQIIDRQINRVGTVCNGLSRHCEFIELKMQELEKRYDDVLISVLKMHEESNKIVSRVEERNRDLSEAEVLVNQTEDQFEKLAHLHRHRKTRKEIQSNLHRIGLNERAISILKNELPVLDGLGDISEAYLFTLKEIVQEADLMKSHLQIVSSLYTNMMRTHEINSDLTNEMKRLFSYAQNMSSTLEKGSKVVIGRANNSSILERQYDSSSQSMEDIILEIENVASQKFEDLERRLEGYSTQMKGGN